MERHLLFPVSLQPTLVVARAEPQERQQELVAMAAVVMADFLSEMQSQEQPTLAAVVVAAENRRVALRLVGLAAPASSFFVTQSLFRP
jgi:hypothetical protein